MTAADRPSLARLREVRTALRREVGPSGTGDGDWQPMVAASEVWALLDALDAVEALADEWGAAAKKPKPKRAPTESAQDQGVRIGVWHSVAVAASELRAALDGAQSGEAE